ncbi:sialidase family protein [Paenibacillus sp. FSL M8-0228]|jgi:hypothetical protein|uniref:sialidase family protein n=1 Tax=Paenibacillus TaxID=44249 RepID=UPI00083CD891|nr:sialidase family protein [Paenibacillus polymyxa]ODB51973.1 hypothetical protein A7311_07230 [Paenibacillus polymyxa]
MPNVQLTPNGRLAQEPSVAFNLLDGTIVSAAIDFTTGPPLTAVYRSGNGGASFTQQILPLPAGYVGAESHSVSYGFPNLFVIACHVFTADGLSGTIATYVSRDNGNTFDPPVIAQRGYGTFVNNVEVSVKFDTSQVSSYTGNIYLCYTHQYNPDFFGGSVMFFQRSQDGGITWGTPVVLTAGSNQITRGEITVSITGVIYVGYIVTNPVNQYQVIVSFNGGTAFSSSLPVSSVVPVPSPLPVAGFGFNVLPAANIAVDRSTSPNQGTLYAVWQDNRAGYADVLLARSVNGGLSWTAPQSVTGASAGAQHFFPAIDVSPVTGVIKIVYYTNQITTSLLDVFVAESTDGGSTFTNLRITDSSFNPNGISPVPVVTIGNFIDVTIVPNNGFFAVWTDALSGFQQIYGSNGV